MKFGLILPVEGFVTEKKPNPKLVLRVAERAEELGYDSVWAGERLLFTQRLDPIAILSAVASKTTRIKLGTAVMIAPLKHPLVLAGQLSTLDNISDGRLIAGFGVGAERVRVDYDSVGVPFTERGRRLNECLKILRQAWSDKEISFEGKYYQVKGVQLNVKPVQENGPPIFLGGMGKPVSLKRVAKFADGWIPLEAAPPAYERALNEIKSYQPRRSVQRALYLTVNIQEDVESSRKEARRFFDEYYNTSFPSIEGHVFVGTVNDCVSRLQEYSNLGVQTVVVRFASFKDPVKETEAFKEQIATRF